MTAYICIRKMKNDSHLKYFLSKYLRMIIYILNTMWYMLIISIKYYTFLEYYNRIKSYCIFNTHSFLNLFVILYSYLIRMGNDLNEYKLK